MHSGVTVYVVHLGASFGKRLVLSCPRRAGGAKTRLRRFGEPAIWFAARDGEDVDALVDALVAPLRHAANAAANAELDDETAHVLFPGHQLAPSELERGLDVAIELAIAAREHIAR